jgi:hypothetical protein
MNYSPSLPALFSLNDVLVQFPEVLFVVPQLPGSSQRVLVNWISHLELFPSYLPD